MFSGLKRWLAGRSAPLQPPTPATFPARFFEADFDAAWYLKTYPDVADAGLDPWSHFTTRGLAEGRLPCASKAAILDFRLWGGLEQKVLSELKAMSEGRDSCGEPVSQEERARAARALQRWRSRKSDTIQGGIAQGAHIVGDEPVPGATDDFARLRAEAVNTGLFDRNWYLIKNEDVLFSTRDPFEHFWSTGHAEGRDPSPAFSSSGYHFYYPEVGREEPALAHYLREGRGKGYSALPEIPGAISEHPEGVSIMICGHQVGAHLYGAERSLLDLLDAFQRIGVNAIVTLPSAINASYVQAVAAQAQKLVILPYGWWRAGHESCAETVAIFRHLLRAYKTEALYTNTSVLDEPLSAARAEGIPAVIHVRELPQWDEALCRVLNTDSAGWLERIKASADVLVANSATAARAIGGEDVITLPNIVDPDVFERARAVRQDAGGCVNVALLSSNLPKKGLADFLSLAEKLSEQKANVRCVIFGPDNAHIDVLRKEIASGSIKGNIRLAGYAASPDVALAQSDIIVNLSHFQESFGRTVLEAMAAAKPVVAYDWGALPELIEDGKTGFLVPLGDVDKVAECVIELSESGELRHAMGNAGYRVAVQRYGPEALSEQLSVVVRRIESLRLTSSKS